jgi:hypothetical protein
VDREEWKSLAEVMEVCKQCVTSDLHIRGPFLAGTLAVLSRSQHPFMLSVPSLPLNV